jgi:7,8-dihydropterin-6-yl-methyl-4-(beta-D-ribofuranosyl)aminobenzene 5'-phosphate synthase
MTLFVPRSLSKHLIDDLKILTKEVIVISKPQKLFKNFYSTGLLGKEMPEQSLIIDGAMPMLIMGCGHFGVENIAKKASLWLHKKIKSCIGGFHLMKKSQEEIKASIITLKTMGIVQVCPTHCSGDLSIAMFQKYFKNGYIQGGVGAKI